MAVQRQILNQAQYDIIKEKLSTYEDRAQENVQSVVAELEAAGFNVPRVKAVLDNN